MEFLADRACLAGMVSFAPLTCPEQMFIGIPRTRARIRRCVAVTTPIALGLALPVSAHAIDPGVTYDPGTPAGKEYAIPIVQGRADGAGTENQRAAANTPFGVGVTPPGGGGKGGGGASGRSGRGTKTSGSGAGRQSRWPAGCRPSPASRAGRRTGRDQSLDDRHRAGGAAVGRPVRAVAPRPPRAANWLTHAGPSASRRGLARAEPL